MRNGSATGAWRSFLVAGPRTLFVRLSALPFTSFIFHRKSTGLQPSRFFSLGITKGNCRRWGNNVMRPSNNTKLRAIPDRLTNNLKQQRWLFFLILFFFLLLLFCCCWCLTVRMSCDILAKKNEQKKGGKKKKRQKTIPQNLKPSSLVYQPPKHRFITRHRATRKTRIWKHITRGVKYAKKKKTTPVRMCKTARQLQLYFFPFLFLSFWMQWKKK